MKTVVWTEDLEPATIIDLPMFAIQLLKRSNFRWRIQVPKPFKFARYSPEDASIFMSQPMEVCEIWGEVIRRGQHETLFAFVDEWNEGNALALQPEYLAGQIADLRKRERLAYIGGVLGL